jgi:hypothetical protein
VSVENRRDRGDVGVSAFENDFDVLGVDIGDFALLLDVNGTGNENDGVVRIDNIGGLAGDTKLRGD